MDNSSESQESPLEPFWKQRHKKFGRPRAFATANKLREAFYAYCAITDRRKWVKKDWVGKDAMPVDRETETPYSLAGFCIYLGLSRNWWNELKKSSTLDDDYLGVIAHIEEVILTQQIEGATVGAFNANIISRLNGLTERQDVTSGNKPLPTQSVIMVQNTQDAEIVKKALES